MKPEVLIGAIRLILWDPRLTDDQRLERIRQEVQAYDDLWTDPDA